MHIIDFLTSKKIDHETRLKLLTKFQRAYFHLIRFSLTQKDDILLHSVRKHLNENIGLINLIYKSVNQDLKDDFKLNIIKWNEMVENVQGGNEEYFFNL